MAERDFEIISDAEPQAAVALVLAQREAALLLCRRSERPDDPWSGHWCLPGGRIDPGDADAVAAARRELHEECGVMLPAPPQRTLPRRLAGRAVGRPLVVAGFLWEIPAAVPVQVDPVEIAAACWVPLAELRDPMRREQAELARGRPGVLYPCIRLEGAPLWGFTFGVVMELLAERE
jgi:8-oxo-dGTP pyrophosphatase MutT (NUDIX family)